MVSAHETAACSGDKRLPHAIPNHPCGRRHRGVQIQQKWPGEEKTPMSRKTYLMVYGALTLVNVLVLIGTILQQ